MSLPHGLDLLVQAMRESSSDEGSQGQGIIFDPEPDADLTQEEDECVHQTKRRRIGGEMMPWLKVFKPVRPYNNPGGQNAEPVAEDDCLLTPEAQEHLRQIHPDLNADLFKGAVQKLKQKARPLAGRGASENGEFDLLASMCTLPELVVELSNHLRPVDITNLYCISLPYHEIIKSYFGGSIRVWYRRMAPLAGCIFSFRMYNMSPILDASGRSAHPVQMKQPPRPNAQAVQPAARTNPKNTRKAQRNRILVWLQMVVDREKKVRDILAIMARMGFRTPPTTLVTLMKLWVVMDIAYSQGRKRAIGCRTWFTDHDLFNAHVFVTKLLMLLNDPDVDQLDDTFLHTLLGQQSGMTALWAFLRCTRYITAGEVREAVVRFDKSLWHARHHFQGGSVLGVPVGEVGRGHLEGWGTGPRHLDQPVELIVQEAIARNMRFDEVEDDDPRYEINHVYELILYGNIDFSTGKNEHPSIEEMYASDDELPTEPAEYARSSSGGCGNVPFRPGMWTPALIRQLHRDFQAGKRQDQMVLGEVSENLTQDTVEMPQDRNLAPSLESLSPSSEANMRELEAKMESMAVNPTSDLSFGQGVIDAPWMAQQSEGIVEFLDNAQLPLWIPPSAPKPLEQLALPETDVFSNGTQNEETNQDTEDLNALADLDYNSDDLVIDEDDDFFYRLDAGMSHINPRVRNELDAQGNRDEEGNFEDMSTDSGEEAEEVDMTDDEDDDGHDGDDEDDDGSGLDTLARPAILGPSAARRFPTAHLVGHAPGSRNVVVVDVSHRSASNTSAASRRSGNTLGPGSDAPSGNRVPSNTSVASSHSSRVLVRVPNQANPGDPASGPSETRIASTVSNPDLEPGRLQELFLELQDATIFRLGAHNDVLETIESQIRDPSTRTPGTFQPSNYPAILRENEEILAEARKAHDLFSRNDDLQQNEDAIEMDGTLDVLMDLNEAASTVIREYLTSIQPRGNAVAGNTGDQRAGLQLPRTRPGATGSLQAPVARAPNAIRPVSGAPAGNTFATNSTPSTPVSANSHISGPWGPKPSFIIDHYRPLCGSAPPDPILSREFLALQRSVIAVTSECNTDIRRLVAEYQNNAGAGMRERDSGTVAKAQSFLTFARLLRAMVFLKSSHLQQSVQAVSQDAMLKTNINHLAVSVRALLRIPRQPARPTLSSQPGPAQSMVVQQSQTPTHVNQPSPVTGQSMVVQQTEAQTPVNQPSPLPVDRNALCTYTTADVHSGSQAPDYMPAGVQQQVGHLTASASQIPPVQKSFQQHLSFLSRAPQARGTPHSAARRPPSQA